MKTPESRLWTVKFAKTMTVVWLPIVLLIAAVLWLFYQTEKKAQLATIKSEEYFVLNIVHQAIDSEVAMFSGDALFLSEHSDLHFWLNKKNSSAWGQLTKELLDFTQSRPFYTEVRILNLDGREILRINQNEGNLSVVPKSQLQDKSQRNYVQRGLKLKDHQVYISAFDLNTEHGVVEIPLNPVIRVVTPIFDHAGHKRALAILNYKGKRLLNRLREIQGKYDRDLWLINGDGYWLMGPRPEVEWNFMFPDKDARFSETYQSIWKVINNGAADGQILNEKGLFTYNWVNPASLHLDASGERLLVVSHVSNAMLVAAVEGYRQLLVIVFATFALALAVATGFFTRYRLQHRRSQIRVKESEARYRNLVDCAPDPIVVSDKEGRILLVNSQVEKCFGYNRDELLGNAVEILVPKRFREQHVKSRYGYLTKPYVRSMGNEGTLYGLRKSGEEFPVEIGLSPVETEGGLLVTTIIRDVTARKQAEEAQRHIQGRYQELVNNLPVGVFRKTPGQYGEFLEVNPAMVEMFEADSADQLLKYSVSDLYCDPSYRLVVSNKLLEYGSVRGEELKMKTLRGREFYAALTAVTRKDDNGNVWFDGIVEDITEWKTGEIKIRELNENLRAYSTDLEVANRELESFSYSVSHDLRAPLRALDGYSYMLQSDYADQLDDEGLDRLQRMRSAAQRMAQLIDDLLELSRVSRTKVRREPVDLNMIAEEVIHYLRNGEPQRRVDIVVQPDLKTNGDPRLLRVVMDNLIGNAWKFTSRRADAHIEIGGRKNGEKVVYYVRDNGAGFDMAYVNKLFGPFQRLHDVGDYQGTGIGLATVQRVIDKHGGKIWAEAEVDHGATFYFSL